jgi:methylthioribose-1-phosphate isomerase
MSGFETIAWGGEEVIILDQTKLPAEETYLHCRDHREVAEAIRKLSVRGAPAIGVAAGMGLALGAGLLEDGMPRPEFKEKLEEISRDLAATRPTAVNLFWALDRMAGIYKGHPGSSVPEIKAALVAEALKIQEEDRSANVAMGKHGAPFIKAGDRVLTHCNAGALATAAHGTALGVIRTAREEGRDFEVLADETRPLLQGARLTAWELARDGIPVRVITDSMAASMMSRGLVDLVIVGADRIAANGDVANKIGTYGLAVLSEAHGLPFYVAAPSSTFDLSLSDGRLIPIEEREEEEVTVIGGRRLVPTGVPAANPAFDVTPARLVTAMITEKGVIYPPYDVNIKKVLEDF